MSSVNILMRSHLVSVLTINQRRSTRTSIHDKVKIVMQKAEQASQSHAASPRLLLLVTQVIIAYLARLVKRGLITNSFICCLSARDSKETLTFLLFVLRDIRL